MFRLLGFLLGSTVAIATFLFILGLPKFHFDDAQLDSPIDSPIREAAIEDIQADEAVVAPVLPVLPVLPVEPPEIEMRWYSFWNPFRSEIAAKGFVSQLEEVTGLDYRIVKVEAGVYEVAFAYIDDTERTNKLEQISAATGLDLTES
jgi:hypothetical protein